MTTTQPIEVKKDGLRQMQDGTWKLSLTVHPEDMPTSLMTAQMGTRYGMALVEINDDETPVAAPEPRERRDWHELSPVQQAGIRCGDPGFRKWLFGGNFTGTPDAGAIRLRQILDIASRKELDTNSEKRAAWEALDARFVEETRTAERHV